MDLPILLVK